VIYRPETELASHYFQAVLPDQFDEYVWFDETRAITPFDTKALEGLPDTLSVRTLSGSRQEWWAEKFAGPVPPAPDMCSAVIRYRCRIYVKSPSGQSLRYIIRIFPASISALSVVH
jgi:hypothetical protein